MPSPIDMIFHGKKASNNGFPLFVNTKALAAADGEVAGCLTKVASTAASALKFVNNRRATEVGTLSSVARRLFTNFSALAAVLATLVRHPATWPSAAASTLVLTNKGNPLLEAFLP